MAESPYYPPRANCFSSLWQWGYRLSRSKPVQLLALSPGATLQGTAAAFFIPGMGIYLRRPSWGITAMLACLTASVVFLVRLGYSSGNVAVGTLMSIHVLAITYYLRPLLDGARLGFRLLASLALWFLVLGGIYLPLLHYCEAHWFVPIRFHDKVVIIRARSKAPALHRGDWAAFQYVGWQADHVYARSGISLAPVIALAGDELQFTFTNLYVNGVARPALGGMPQSGGITVPEKSWFAWVDFGIWAHGVSSAAIADARVRSGIVPLSQYIGEPFHWWFWRNQSLP